MSPATPGRAPQGAAPRALTTDTLRIREVWAENLDEEMLLIRDLVDQYNHLAMDTEFPGVVARPVGTFKTPGEYQYQTLRCNVDMLKIIQLGLTFSDAEGNLPVVDGCFSAWQFNFREFDVAADMYAADSIELLRHSGIDFAAHAARGIDTRRFGEALLVSGVVLIPDVRWITFHSGYDFGYLLKLVTCLPLPATEAEFFEVLGLYFPVIYDMKYLMKFCDSLHGGLQKLAEVLDVERIGPQHQAGSDALLTSRTFFRLREVYFKAPPPPAGSSKAADPNGALERYVNVLYGLGVDGQAATGDDTAAAAD